MLARSADSFYPNAAGIYGEGVTFFTGLLAMGRVPVMFF